MTGDGDYLDDLDYESYVKQRPRPQSKIKDKPPKRRTLAQMRRDAEARVTPRGPVSAKPSRAQTISQLTEIGSARPSDNFSPTIAALGAAKNHVSNHEREWIMTYLGAFYHDRLITDVLRRVKGGKEATVYCCRADPSTGMPLVAGKVYHERMFRSLKNDAIYRQGRGVVDDTGKGMRGRREAVAMQKSTGFGQQLRHVSWLTNEFQTLHRLHAAGADVPKPLAQSDNAILMEYMGEERFAAPVLINVRLQQGEAEPLFRRILGNIELMLANDLVHGDLSAYNVLYWEGEIKIIDFPQAVDPYNNPDAYALFERDVTRICEYFGRYSIRSHGPQMAREIWERCIVT